MCMYTLPAGGILQRGTHIVPDSACIVVDSKLRHPLLWLLVVWILVMLLVTLVHK